MRTNVEHGDQGVGLRGEPAAAGACGDPPLWKLGSRVATRNVQAARKAYLRCAETTERTLNHVDSTTSRVSEDLWTMASTARETLFPPRTNGSASAQAGNPAERGVAAMKAKVAQGRADFRDVLLRGQIAADTNVRAYLDHLDDLATASSARRLVSAQTAFFWDQWQRSLQQVFDLQRRTVGALRKATSAPAA